MEHIRICVRRQTATGYGKGCGRAMCAGGRYESGEGGGGAADAGSVDSDDVCSVYTAGMESAGGECV